MSPLFMQPCQYLMSLLFKPFSEECADINMMGLIFYVNEVKQFFCVCAYLLSVFLFGVKAVMICPIF